MLRESISLSTGDTLDLSALTDRDCKEIPGIPHSDVLIDFADCFMGADADAYQRATNSVAEVLGEAALVDAIGIASNFQRMVRIADGTGIPSDGPMVVMAEDLLEQIGTESYNSAANTKKPGFLKAWFFKLLAVPGMRKMIREASSGKD